MEASSSSNTTNQDLMMPESVVDNKTKIGSSVGGRKSEDIVADLVEVSSDEVSSDEPSYDVEEEDYDSEEEESEEEDDDDDNYDEEEEEEDRERALILSEMKTLKKLAEFFQHPEKAVEVDGFAAGRSYFSRPSAEEFLSEEEEEDAIQALKDAQALKQLAVNYQHPERPLEIDATACARNYFSQPWASEQETFGQAEQRARVVAESQLLKKQAAIYQHPEAAFDMETGGRNYFQRASAPEEVDEEERALILQEMKALKQAAVDYMHPEKPLDIDAAAFGRNYFQRASAPEQEDDEYCDDREIILEEMKELKQAAVDYMHPEKPLDIDAAAFGRNYFQRASAPEQEEDEYCDDREIILEEMKELKQAAANYMHPEAPVQMDALASARSYFDRHSAEDQDDSDAERDLILQEMQALKKLAVDYMHPEKPVEVDGTACARNYFTRPSAPEQDDNATERDLILQEMQALKKLAVDYRHPEKSVEVDATACARNYFSRPSAPEQEDEDEAAERELILQEAALMKQKAVDYMHPELEVAVDPTAFGRNYYGRASAIDTESFAQAEERARIIAEASMLKQKAVDFMHPERSVGVDAAAFGRNYFARPSAEDDESVDEEERARVLAEAAQLKKLAADYMHPERPVVVDPCAYGRNYFGRASAIEQEDDEFDDERQVILEELAELKQAAVDYMHPEKPVSVDPASFGRNYFGRASAPSQESFGEAEERARVLAEATSLKKLASVYAHPEAPVATDATAFGRNYFSRPSAPEFESLEEAQERAHVLDDARALKKTATVFLHPEYPVKSDAALCARSYFSRASAPDQDVVEDAQERARVLAEASALKKLAVDYLHPELSVKTSDPAACGRNYFSRASAPGAADHISTSGHANQMEAHEHAEEHSHHDDYGHFEMDEELFYDMRQSILLPLPGDNGPKIQSSKISSDEEGELSRSPSSVMLFMGALEDDHPPLPSMG